MGSAFKVGRVAGIDVKVHWTFFLLVTFFAISGYEVTGSLALPVVEGSKLVGMLTIEDVGHARLLGQPTTSGGKG
jgi:CBS domain-containing protein